MTKPDLTQAETVLLGRMVVASTGAGPFPQDAADALAREMGVSYERAAVVKAVYDAGAAAEDGGGRFEVSVRLVSPGRQALRRDLLGLLAMPLPEVAPGAGSTT